MKIHWIQAFLDFRLFRLQGVKCDDRNILHLSMLMDIHLDILLNLPNVTVFTCEQVEGFTVLQLKFLNERISCPHCHSYTDEVHQNRPILVRDLPISGRKIYLKVPRRQFYCQNCKRYSTERLSFLEARLNYTLRYEDYIYEQVKELTIEQVSAKEELSYERVSNIFHRISKKKIKIGESLSV